MTFQTYPTNKSKSNLNLAFGAGRRITKLVNNYGHN